MHSLNTLNTDARRVMDFYEVWYWFNTPFVVYSVELIGIFITRKKSKHLRYNTSHSFHEVLSVRGSL